MAWKVEKWLTEVFPGQSRIYDEYHTLPPRELVIVGAASLDLALAELLSKRVIDNPQEYEEFLGLNEDGRAPAGSFGARIQMALLLGILTEGDAAALRIIKKIRNRFAHRVRISFSDAPIKTLLSNLLDVSNNKKQFFWNKTSGPGGNKPLKNIKAIVNAHPEGGAAVFLVTFSIYQAYFHRLASLVERVEIIGPKGAKT